MSELKELRRRRSYPLRTKLSAVRGRVSGELSYAETLSKYEVSSSTFSYWMSQYKTRVLEEEELKRLSSRRYKRLHAMTDNERTELESLRKALAQEQLLREAYELMIELAKERLHIDVKKNYEQMLSQGLVKEKKRKQEKP